MTESLREIAERVADLAQYGWCESEQDGIKDPGIKQLQDDIFQALKSVSERIREEMREKVYDCSAKYFPPDADIDAIGVQLEMRKKILDEIGWPKNRGVSLLDKEKK
jgi:hypothetical protein